MFLDIQAIVYSEGGVTRDFFKIAHLILSFFGGGRIAGQFLARHKRNLLKTGDFFKAPLIWGPQGENL